MAITASPVAPFKMSPTPLTDDGQGVQRIARVGKGRYTQIAFDRQQTKIAVATTLGVYLYDAQTFTHLNFRATSAPVQTVAFAPDGTEIAFSTISPNAQLYRWRYADDSITTQPLTEALTHGLAFSPDGAYLVGLGFYQLLIWETSGAQRLMAHAQAGALHKNFAFSPDGRRLVVLTRDRLDLWQLHNGILRQTIAPAIGHYFSTARVTFSPTGSQLVIAGLREPLLYTWTVTAHDLLTDPTVHQVGNDAASIVDFQFAPQGAQIAIGLSDGVFNIYPMPLPTKPTATWQLAAAIDRVTWSTDAALVAAALVDGSVHIWASASMEPQPPLILPPAATPGSIDNLHMTADNRRITVVLATGAFYHWQLTDGKLLSSLEQHNSGSMNSVVFTQDGSQVVIGAEHGIVQFWAWARGLALTNYRTQAGQVDAVALSPDGAWLAAAFSKPVAFGVWADPIQLYRIATNGETQPIGYFADDLPFTTLDTDDTGFVTTCGVFWNNVVFAQDGQTVAASSFAHKALLWRRRDGLLLHQFEGHTSAILDLALSPDGALLATASDDGDVRVWQTSDGQVRYRLPDHVGGAVAVAFSPDGQWLATRTALGDVRLWRLADGKSSLVFTNIKNPRSNLAFSPDGAYLASGTTENAALLWSVADSTQAYLLEGHNGLVNGVAFSPDGAHLATASEDGTTLIWTLPTVRR